MYVIPGYVDHWEEDGAVYIESRLWQNKVRLTEAEVIEEFRAMVKRGGCLDISTQLTRFLHGQKLLANDREIEDSVNELKRVMEDILILTMMPTEGCNFRCPYCYEDHAPVSMRREVIEQIKRYIGEQAPRFKRVDIQWFGGEPTLCKDTVLEVNQMVQELQKRHGFQFTSGMTTNGYLLSRESFLQYYDVGVTSYQITLDGRTHDQTRPHVSGRGTLQTILENLTDITALPREEYAFHITLRHNILPGDEDFSWYDHLFRLFGADDRFSVVVRPVGDWGGESVKSLDVLKGDDTMPLLQKHVEYLQKLGMPCQNGQKSVLSQVCYASYPHSIVFRADGTPEKCTVALGHPKNRIGYVDDDEGVVLDEAANRLWSAGTLKPECRHCADVLSCLNLQCGKHVLIDGAEDTACSYVRSKFF